MRKSLSVVIPAKNEERVLPALLDALETQTLKPHEVIVADAGSTDRTRQIAATRGCRVVPGGLPSVGRNSGARAARSEIIVFLDSDVFVEPRFLEEVERQIRTRHLEAGAVYNLPRYRPGDKGHGNLGIRLFDRLIYLVHNVGLELSALVRLPYATGTCMFATRELFHRAGGFDERIVAFEDSELASRLARLGRYGVVKRPVVWISTRRFDRHNRIAWVFYLVVRVGRARTGDRSHRDYFEKGSAPAG